MPAPAKPTIALIDSQRNLADQYRGLAGRAAKKVWFDSGRIPDLADLRQAAMVGLCDAARLFDPARGFRFSTYATRACYFAALHEAVTQGVIGLPNWHASMPFKDNPFASKVVATRYPVHLNPDIDNRAAPEAADSDRRADLAVMMAILGPVDHEMLVRWSQGETQREIGRRIGLSMKTVNKRINLALARIRQQFGDDP